MKKWFHHYAFLGLVLLLLTGCGRPSGDTNTPRQLIEARCARCHGLQQVFTARSKEEWPVIVTRMLQKSPRLLSESEKEAVITYLQENYAK